MNYPAIVGLLTQATAAAQTPEVTEITEIGSSNHSILNLMLNADVVVQVMMVLLFFFSVVSWAIIGSKHRQLKNAKQRSNRFFHHFWQAKSIDAIVSKGSFRKSPAFNVFKAGVDTLRDDQAPNALKIVSREIRRTTDDEIEQMEYGVPFLATTTTVAPFLGLFGTVWGILNAFWKIGRTGASSLSIVGPDIAQALISTAVGLAAAIPAVIFYNYYVNRIRLIAKDLDDFADDLTVRIGNEYFKEA